MDLSIVEKIKKADVSKYRSIPFWSWNDKLEPDELVWQIEWMKENGFGGYFMHARGGLTTEYLGDDWFKCIDACLDVGKRVEMESWAYDENGWPSGFAGGKLLEDAENRDRYLTYKFGDYDKSAYVSYLVTEDNLIRTAEGGKGQYLNVYLHISVSTVDILNPDVVDKFLALTHQTYKEKLGEKFNECLKGFFTDEPQYYRWGQPYSKMLPGYFKEKYGEDILDRLGLLFAEKKGYRDFRYKFWKAMQTLMLNNFAKKINDWCETNGVQLTGHYIEESSLLGQMQSCGGIMPFYEYEGIPGVDWLGRYVGSPVSPKQVGSVARQLGKKRVMTETFAMCGWDVTPIELKTIAEWQYVYGVNLMCQHLLPYSEHGQRKRDYPAHYSWANPWVRKDFKSFNDYFARLGYLLAESEEVVNVGVLSTVSSMYFDHKWENNYINDIDSSYIKLTADLGKRNIPFHILDETIMEKHAHVKDGKLIVGNCSYDYIVFPKVNTLSSNSARLIGEFFKEGGKILFTDDIPGYLEGEPHVYNFKSNVTIEEIAAAQPYTVDLKNTYVATTFRRYEGREFIFAVNTSMNDSYTLRFSGNFKGFTSLDLETMETKQTSAKLDFAPCQSYVLFLSDKESDYSPIENATVLDGEFKVVNSSDNYLTLDKIRFSTDGVNYSEKLRYMGIFYEMLERRYEGELFLKYEFTVRDMPEKLYFLSENMNNIECTLNGKVMTFDGVSDFEKQLFKADISSLAKVGLNEAVIKINFHQGENVYYALFGENVTESLKNCLAYDTTIEACYIQGDFGVYSEGGFVKGKEKNVLIAEDDFYIGKKKEFITDTVKDGYPFFAGDITLEKDFEFKGGKCFIDLKGRFHLCDLSVNGKKVKKSYFSDLVEVTDYVVDGKNTARITLYSSNRNLMGPHHLKDSEECFSVGPHSWELQGSWKSGKSSQERDNYSFVRFGLFND